jgi:UDP-4-amino-4,6-dideoxy-N-acetyl-beta-L-altrosamine transaminase
MTSELIAQNVVPYARQSIDQSDIEAVVDVLRSDFLTQGPAVPRFEQALADRCQARHAVAVNSATSALHLACLALGVGPGDWVWTTPITFVASANAARMCGASVDFVDIDPRTRNLCPQRLEEKLRHATSQGRLPKVIVPVHLAGHPCDLARIAGLAQAHGAAVIEDASHAVGATYQDQPVGTCAQSDLTVMSFHAVKILTTGEGGAVLTRSGRLAQRLRELRSHGVARDPEFATTEGGWFYEMRELGFNYRLSDIHAALGASQLGRLDEFLAVRRLRVAQYNESLHGLPLVLPYESPDVRSSWHLYIVEIDSRRTQVTRREVYDHLAQRGISANVHYIPVHLQPYYRRLGFEPGMFPAAEGYYAAALTLPLFAGMTDEDQERVVGALHEVLA